MARRLRGGPILRGEKEDMSAHAYFDPVNGQRYPLDVPRWRSDEGRPLLVTPQRGISRKEIDRGERSLWRYRAALPVKIEHPISLGEGMTPLVERAWGEFRPHFKLEWFNPTSSFKDRGASVMLSYLRQLGVPAVLEDSSGNGGAAVAAYGAAGGLKVKILAPAYASPAKIAQIRAYGAEVSSSTVRARNRRRKRSASLSRFSIRATTGNRSSSREQSRSPTRSGRIADSSRPTTS